MKKWLQSEPVFIVSSIAVSGGNYLFNILLAKWLFPEVYADIAFLVTLLLGLSFLAMAFQLSATKFQAEENEKALKSLNSFSVYIGMLLTLVFILLTPSISEVFHIKSRVALYIFSFIFMVYFYSSVNRGRWQGRKNYLELSASYQAEMLVRLGLSIFVLFVYPQYIVEGISFALLLSVVASLTPIYSWPHFSLSSLAKFKYYFTFFILTLLYEMSLVMINNTDIFLVKHYFPNTDAGIYSSMALLGRMIYFFSWMFVMTFIPALISASKQGKSVNLLLAKTLGVVFIFSAVATGACYFFGYDILKIMFNEQYTIYASQLWIYALATSFFACANIFTYYFLAFENYRLVYISLFFALMQIIAIMKFHSSIAQVIQVQLVLMGLLLLVNSLYYLSHRNKNARSVRADA